MKIIENVKKMFTKGTNLVLDGIKIHKQYNELKSRILETLKLEELKDVCKEFDIQINKKKLYRTHIHKNIELGQLIKYCKNKNISKIIKEKEKIEKQYNHRQVISNKLETDEFDIKVKPNLDIEVDLKRKIFKNKK
jgi:hypothetical protein